MLQLIVDKNSLSNKLTISSVYVYCLNGQRGNEWPMGINREMYSGNIENCDKLKPVIGSEKAV